MDAVVADSLQSSGLDSWAVRHSGQKLPPAFLYFLWRIIQTSRLGCTLEMPAALLRLMEREGGVWRLTKDPICLSIDFAFLVKNQHPKKP